MRTPVVPSRKRDWTLPILLFAGATFSSLFIWLGVRADRPILDAGWSVTNAEIVDSRVMQDQINRIRGGPLEFSGEYKLHYSVGGKVYEVWHDAGIDGDTRQDVESRLGNARPFTRYVIRYNPKNPNEFRVQLVSQRQPET